MENPATWDRLTSSLAVCDLQMLDKVWAFLVLQGLVRDLPGDRDFFYGIIQQEKALGEITGGSLQSRISGRLQEFDIALPISAEPDSNAGIAKKRLASLHDLMKDKEPFQATRKSKFCTHCGFEGDKRISICPACGEAFHDSSATCEKLCEQCQTLNPLSASFCYGCGKSFGGLNSFVQITGGASSLPAQSYFHQPRSYCSYCGANNNADYKYCRACGISGADPCLGTNTHNAHVTHVTGITDSLSPSDDAQPSEFWQARMFRLIDDTENDRPAADILSVLISVMQDLVVMKELLKEKGVWDEASYKKHRIERMISDHSSAGATPWKTYSYFPYTLDEEEFLKQVFAASKEEIEKFKDEVESISELS